MKYYHLILNQAVDLPLLPLVVVVDLPLLPLVVVVADRLLLLVLAVVLLPLPVAVDPDLHLPLLLLVPERNK